MTGRVCPVHGEYAPTGVCRWCETGPEDVELPGMVGQWRKPDRVEVNEAGVPSYFWDLGTYTLLNPTYMLVSWDAVLREAAKGPVSRKAVDAAEESRLLAQHAALRWERVARRWAAKGPTPPLHRMTLQGEIAFDDHCATCRQVRDKLIKAWFPKEWP